ncbi:DNA alkylation repair protein [Sporocytophaga myxococcoides]|uniref:DNA alkylation repair protein n=1 Tax=Sporocytophaga myxococcoides TaxID=153721 RepID=UPI00041D9580|nr:DNA alkylation repair protein [Sporocytophaga myxococcoides]
MKSITQKGDLNNELQHCFEALDAKGFNEFLSEVHHRLLLAKIKFPLLEYCATEIFKRLDEKDHIEFCSGIAKLKTIGGNVLIGIILQRRLSVYFTQSMEKAADYIEQGEEWYVTDIIGERVFGVALLRYNTEALNFLYQLSNNASPFVVRSIGPGAHFAIKKGLPLKETEGLFKLLLSLANAKDGEIKRGIGWAAKTTAKFYPEIIKKYRDLIDDPEKTGAWFRTKLKIGLDRNLYAKGNRS